MYTKIIFGHELKKRLLEKQLPADIGVWAHSTYLRYIEDIDLDFRDILLTLNTMELGPEFVFSDQILHKIADDLIQGNTVDLSSKEYSETGH